MGSCQTGGTSQGAQLGTGRAKYSILHIMYNHVLHTLHIHIQHCVRILMQVYVAFVLHVAWNRLCLRIALLLFAPMAKCSSSSVERAVYENSKDLGLSPS